MVIKDWRKDYSVCVGFGLSISKKQGKENIKIGNFHR